MAKITIPYQPTGGFLRSALNANFTELYDGLLLKVDKVTGKGLSTNDYTTLEQTKLSGIEAGANLYVHPESHAPSIITQDTNNRFVTDTEKSAWNGKLALTGGTVTGALEISVPTGGPLTLRNVTDTGYTDINFYNDTGVRKGYVACAGSAAAATALRNNMYMGTPGSQGSLIFLTQDIVRMTIDQYGTITCAGDINSNGNVGIGTTLKSWNNSLKVLQIGNAMAFGNDNTNTRLYSNIYNDGNGNKYMVDGYGMIHSLEVSSGNYSWYTAPSGSAGAAATVTQRMILTNTGSFGLGVTSPITKFHVNLGTDQNLGFQSNSSVVNLTAFNDAGNAYVPLLVSSTSLKFDNTSLGFFNGTPAAKTTVADLTGSEDLAGVISKVNALLDCLQSYGLC